MLLTSALCGQMPVWKQACSVAYSDTIVDGVRSFEFLVVGDSAIYTFGVHPRWESFVNVETTGTPRKVARRALEAADSEVVTTWVQQMCRNAFLSKDISGMLFLDFDDSGWSTTWTHQGDSTYRQRFILLKGDTRKCFDRIRASQGVVLGLALGQAGRGTVSVALRIPGSLHGITDSTVVTKEMMLSATGIEVVVEDAILKTVEFTITTIVGDSIMQATSQNADLTDEQRMVIGAASSDSKIYIENIKVMDPLGGIHTVGSKVVFVR